MPLSSRGGGSVATLSDVDLTGLAPGDVLVFDVSGKWLPAALPPPGPHVHDAADVTTGVFVNDRLYNLTTTSTTDATPTLIATVATTADAAIDITAYVQGHRTGGIAGASGDGATFTRKLRVKREAGVVTLGVMQSVATDRDQASWNVTASVLGANVRFFVTGALDNNIDWQASLRIFEV